MPYLMHKFVLEKDKEIQALILKILYLYITGKGTEHLNSKCLFLCEYGGFEFIACVLNMKKITDEIKNNAYLIVYDLCYYDEAVYKRSDHKFVRKRFTALLLDKSFRFL